NVLINGSACFTTGIAADNTPPSVTAINPPNGSTAVPLNAAITAQVSEPLNAVSFVTLAQRTVEVPLSTTGSAPMDLGLFPGGASIPLVVTGHGDIVNSNFQVNPDGSLYVPALNPYLYANPGASGYPTNGGGDGVNHFPGGGLNIGSNKYGFAGKPTTDTT